MMEQSEIDRVVFVASTADGGCSGCFRDLLIELSRRPPNVDWIGTAERMAATESPRGYGHPWSALGGGTYAQRLILDGSFRKEINEAITKEEAMPKKTKTAAKRTTKSKPAPKKTAAKRGKK